MLGAEMLGKGLLLSIACGALLTACVGLETGARARFAMLYSCPDERVQVVAREDLRWGEVRARYLPEPASQPDAEVLSDPERLAKWQQVQKQQAAQRVEAYNGFEVYEVTGCGHQALLGCTHPRSYRGGVIIDAVLCDSPAQLK